MRLRGARSTTPAEVLRVEGDLGEARSDALASEEPLEIRLVWGPEEARERTTVAVTMRTPGADAELAVGFLFAEGVIRRREDIADLRAGDGGEATPATMNLVEVELAPGLAPNLAPLERHFFASSACGVCGKVGIEGLALRQTWALPRDFEVDPGVLTSLPDRLRAAQGLFEVTGGLHAAALFEASGRLLAVREDVGRHNALDKLIGASLLAGELPWSERIVLVSGRSSYEILQKSLAAGVPIVCSVSAPSSLAVELARRFGVTLVGFLRGERFNVYHGAERLRLASAVEATGSTRGAAR